MVDTWNFCLLCPDIAKPLPCWLSQFRKAKLRQPTGQRLSNVRTPQTKISIGPILFSYYEESLVSSNLNSNLLRLHCAHPNIYIREPWTKKIKHYFLTFRCRKQIKSYNGITGLHCRWCHLTLHNRCASHVSPECTLGVNGVHVLPPISICPTVLDRQHSVAKEKHSQRSKKDKNCHEESSQVFRVLKWKLTIKLCHLSNICTT